MPPAEIPHRIGEAIRKRVDRRGGLSHRSVLLPTKLLAAPPPAWPVDQNLLRRRASAAFRNELRAEVNGLLEGRFELLGQTWPLGSRTDWAIDPTSGRRWPWDRYCFDIPRRRDAGPGDVKFVWELSRLQHLQVLALGAFLLDDARARSACVGDLLAWFRDNPPYYGLGYACGIELASRVVSILVVVGLLGPETLAGDLRERIWKGLAAHGAWIERYPSLYSSANNHLVAEAGGLFILGGLAPALPLAPRWRARGQALLEREARRQILPDGVGAEQSPAYQAYSMEWLLAARYIALQTGQQLDPVIDERLAAGADFLFSIADMNGTYPRIGDDDEGSVLRPILRRNAYVLGVAGVAAAATNRAESIHRFGRDTVRAALFGCELPSAEPAASRSRSFEAGGYTVLRMRQGDEERLVVFDHGPLGYAFTAGHGHADALSVWLHVNGRPVLVDGGVYRYGHDGGWRTFLRSVAAHNTIVVDRTDQSEQTGAFNWGRRARAWLERCDLGTDHALVQGAHDGYKQRLGVIHRRTVELCDLDELLIRDELEGSGAHLIRISFHFAAGLTVAASSDYNWLVSGADGPILRLSLAGLSLAGHVASQCGAPGPGAVSPSYNRLDAASALLLEGSVRLPQSWVTTMRFSDL